MIAELREKLLAHLRSGAEPVGGWPGWVDVKVSFTGHGVRFALTCYYAGGEGFTKTTDRDWNFSSEARDLKVPRESSEVWHVALEHRESESTCYRRYATHFTR